VANERAGAFYEREGFTVQRIEPGDSANPALGVVWRARQLRSKPSIPDRRRRARRIAAGITILAPVATACSGTAGSNGDAPGQATTTTVALQPLEQPTSRCGTPGPKATLVRFQAADGTSPNGVLFGRGPAGVILVHQYPSDLCDFWPFAGYLAKRACAPSPSNCAAAA
jgi:hypothetical protein